MHNLLRGLILVTALCVLPFGLAQQADVATQSDVRLVIDVSGSMKRNDPNNLRQPAVDLLLRLLPDDSKAGVWTFGKYVNMLVPHRSVDDSWRDLARSKATEISSVGLYTNIGEALEKAAYDAANPSSQYSTSIILLTDGMVDIDKDPARNKEEWRRIADEVLPRLKNAGVTVHTIALSNKADKDLMQKLALSTDGIAAVANNADELMEIFLKAFDASAPAQELPLVDNAFVVDSSVEEFTALIFRQIATQATQLIGPDEEAITQANAPEDVNWYHTDTYDLITVQQPLEGEWQVRASLEPNSRVTVVSDLSLRVRTLPNNLFKGAIENLNFVLQEEGQTIARKEFLSLLENYASMGFNKEDTSSEQIWSYDFSRTPPPENGIYRVELPVFNKLGAYDILVTVDGKTFKRQYSHRLTVREPFTAELKEVTDDSGQLRQQLTVRAHGQEIIFNKTQIAVAITNPKRRKVVKPLVFTEFDNWQTLLVLDQPGTYSLVIDIAGVDSQNVPFEYQLTPITIEHQADDIFTETEPVAVEQAVDEPLTEPQPDTPPEPEAPVAEAAAPEELEPPVEQEAPPDEQASSSGIPKWVYYLLLGLGNLLILGGGYWLFRKLMTDPEDEDELENEAVQDTPDENLEPEPMAFEPESSDLEMDSMDLDEQEPPMEDLDEVGNTELFEQGEVEEVDDSDPPTLSEPSTDDDFDSFDEDVAPEPDPAPEPASDFAESEAEDNESFDELDEIIEERDLDMDELEKELLEQISADEEGDFGEDKEDFAKEMLKAQGLDLPEDEMDDQIANLIDELDGDRKNKKNQDDSDGLDADDESDPKT